MKIVKVYTLEEFWHIDHKGDNTNKIWTLTFNDKTRYQVEDNKGNILKRFKSFEEATKYIIKKSV